MSTKNLLFSIPPTLARMSFISRTGLIMIGAKEIWTLVRPAQHTKSAGYCPLRMISTLILEWNTVSGRGPEWQLRIFKVFSAALVTANKPGGYKVTDWLGFCSTCIGGQPGTSRAETAKSTLMNSFYRQFWQFIAKFYHLKTNIALCEDWWISPL